MCELLSRLHPKISKAHLHAADVNRQNRCEEKHLQEEVGHQSHDGEQTELLQHIQTSGFGFFALLNSLTATHLGVLMSLYQPIENSGKR